MSGVKTFFEFILCLAIVGAGGYLVKESLDKKTIVNSSQYVDLNTEPTEPEEEEIQGNFVPVMLDVSTKDKYSGDLILVNNDHQYFGSGEEELVNIYDMNEETGRYFFNSVEYDYLIRSAAYEPMARMIEDFYNAYYIDNVVIYGAYRTNELQQQLYDADIYDTGEEESELVAKPGYSEHETGYAFDLSTTPEYEYDGTGAYAWFSENCENYGLILRYPEDKTALTHIQYEPWHFRYTGVPHAVYIMDNNICMEEYITLLRDSYSFESEQHLEITDHSGKNYEIYFVKADDNADTTSVPVPSEYPYDISGNNVDGFIVTVHMPDSSDTAEPTESATTEKTQEPEENN